MAFEFLKDWWAFLAFIATGLFGWVMGVERNRWRINDLGEMIVRLESRVTSLERQGTVEQASLASISTNITAILSTLDRLERRIDGKADR